MGKTFRREKDYWDDEAPRFDRRNSKNNEKKTIRTVEYQENRRNKHRQIDTFFDDERDN
jgi:hypothetical protein